MERTTSHLSTLEPQGRRQPKRQLGFIVKAILYLGESMSGGIYNYKKLKAYILNNRRHNAFSGN